MKLPKSLKIIEDEAFAGCESLRGGLPNNPREIEYIGERAFEGCANLDQPEEAVSGNATGD